MGEQKKRNFTTLTILANSFDDTIVAMRRTDNVDVTFVKELVSDKDILLKLSSSATLAWEASCQTVSELKHQHYLSGRGKDQILVSNTDNTKWDLIPYPHVENGFVAKIFYKRWESVAKEFWEKLEIFENQEMRKKYTFTGFGIGAVIAVFASLEYKMRRKDSSVNLITFGQPRIGTELFIHHTKEILSKVWRVTHGDDWMPNFPNDGFYRVKKTSPSKLSRPRRILYRHFPEEFWIEPSSCHCPDPKIFLCYHTATLYENEDCNARNHFNRAIYPGINQEDSLKKYRESHPDDEHFGPYFGHTMCPFIPKEKLKEKKTREGEVRKKQKQMTFKELLFGTD
ncbi:hypothetical protein G9A89_001240 [Geosiphon pyriformis]|nr:hypothetical protein G9A89_001240 [Geosiphon pyriformis]